MTPASRSAPRLVSVVMPVRNAAETVADQLGALAAQDYTGTWELLVMDDCSEDGTRAIVERCLRAIPAARLLRAGAGAAVGPASARNAGGSLAAGDLLAFCDADDVVSPGWLTGLADGARYGDVIGASLEVSSLNAKNVQRWHGRPPEQRPHQLNRFLPFASTSGCAVWADVFAAVGGFDERRLAAEDKDFCWRAQLAGYRLHYADAVVAYRYRPALRSTAIQEYRWAKADAQLFRDFAARGMKRTAFSYALGSWLRTILGIPALPWASWRRGRWTVRAARCCGRLVGSVRARVFFP